MKENEKRYLCKELAKLDGAMQRAELDFATQIKQVHPANKKNATNMLHYLTLRSHDIRPLQEKLHALGLSSLASSESHIRGQLISIMQRRGKPVTFPKTVFTYNSSKTSLAKKAAGLLGESTKEGMPHIMVTLDTHHADDDAAVKDLIRSGMNIARINCAHNDEATWLRMIEQVKNATALFKKSCKIYMDLAGPKIRTIIPGKGKLSVTEGQVIYLCDNKTEAIHNAYTVGCTIPGIAEQLKPGETILFDDGLFAAKVLQIKDSLACLQMQRISSQKPVIKNEKGINFPDSNLLFPALTAFDKDCLSFVATHADMVGYSFVRHANDVEELRAALGKNKHVAIVIKIETPEAVKNLPSLLLAAMADEFTGVMIARGDLAVEIGFERLSEIQEEILWICESAHIPVIWATQVLENLHKSGVATRSEITDAAYSAHADCVMINKGTYTIRVIETLKDILQRSGAHHIKKRYTFRPLNIATHFMNG